MYEHKQNVIQKCNPEIIGPTQMAFLKNVGNSLHKKC